MAVWKVIERNYLTHMGNYQLMLAREVTKTVHSCTVNAGCEFASMIEGDNDSFVYHGGRNHSCPNLDNCAEVVV